MNKTTKISGITCAIAAVLTGVWGIISGCSGMSDEKKAEIQSALIQHIETSGQEKAIEYINNLVAEGRLGSKNAEELKAQIPLLIEKLKEAKEKDNSNE